MIGDFNVVLGSHEVRGSKLPLKVACIYFRAFTNICKLTHLLTRGSAFIWNNRLDRSMCNDGLLDFWSSSSCCTLVRSKSDHFPLLLSVRKEVQSFSSSFKFIKIWISYPDCKRLIQETWSSPVQGCPMVVLSQKLKMPKVALKDWNKIVFCNVQLRVSNAIAAVEEIQQKISSDSSSDNLFQQEVLAQIDLQKALKFEEDLWREKARIKWHCEGDRNTGFFHRITKIRNCSKAMNMLKNGDEILDEPAAIE